MKMLHEPTNQRYLAMLTFFWLCTCFSLAPNPATAAVLFSDNFNDNSISPSKWTTSGNKVTETGGILKIDNTVTDHLGMAYTSWFNINGSNPITITRKVKVHYANTNSYPEIHFLVDGNTTKYAAGIGYLNSNYQCSFYGFYIVDQPQACTVCVCGDSRSDAITPIWDTWFNEKIIYHPNSGLLEYFINDIKQTEFTVGTAQSQMKLMFDANGWYTGHYQYMDDLVITQDPINRLPRITSFTASPTSGVHPLDVTFLGTAVDPDGTVDDYSWDFGDGSSESTATGQVSHTYTAPGTYNAKLTVTDNEGAIKKSSIIAIRVDNGPELTGKAERYLFDDLTKSINLKLRVVNNGDLPTGPFKVAFNLSDDGTTPLTPAFKTIDVRTGLAAGQNVLLSISKVFAESTYGKYILVYIDSNKEVEETDETNNGVRLVVQPMTTE